MNPTDTYFLQAAIEVSRRARAHGNHPFGAVLVDEHGNLLLEGENTVITGRDCTGHAETNLMREASQRFDKDFLSRCTLYTSTEPCAMCSGAIFWGNIGRVVFGLSEVHLLKLVGEPPDGSFLLLPCRDVFAHGQRPIEVVGPELEEEARLVHGAAIPIYGLS